MYQLKKKGKRRRREREPRNAAKILTLIKAVNDHKGFKQMASYNLSCLCKLVSPPLPDWNENLKFALKHGGLKACTAAVRANSGDESLLLAATSVMDQAATSEEGAAAVVSSGSLDAALAGLRRSKDKELLLEAVSSGKLEEAPSTLPGPSRDGGAMYHWANVILYIPSPLTHPTTQCLGRRSIDW